MKNPRKYQIFSKINIKRIKMGYYPKKHTDRLLADSKNTNQ